MGLRKASFKQIIGALVEGGVNGAHLTEYVGVSYTVF